MSSAENIYRCRLKSESFSLSVPSFSFLVDYHCPYFIQQFLLFLIDKIIVVFILSSFPLINASLSKIISLKNIFTNIIQFFILKIFLFPPSSAHEKWHVNFHWKLTCHFSICMTKYIIFYLYSIQYWVLYTFPRYCTTILYLPFFIPYKGKIQKYDLSL